MKRFPDLVGPSLASTLGFNLLFCSPLNVPSDHCLHASCDRKLSPSCSTPLPSWYNPDSHTAFMTAVMIRGLSSLSIYYTLCAVSGALFVLIHLSYSAPFHPSLLSGVHSQPPTPPFQCLFTDCCSLCWERCSYLSECCELKQDPEH